MDGDLEAKLEECSEEFLEERLEYIAYSRIDDGKLSRVQSNRLIESIDSMDKYDIIQTLISLLTNEEKEELLSEDL